MYDTFSSDCSPYHFAPVSKKNIFFTVTNTIRLCSRQSTIIRLFFFSFLYTRTVSEGQTLSGSWRRNTRSTTSPWRICGSIIQRAARTASLFLSIFRRRASQLPSISFPTYQLFRYTPPRLLLVSPGSPYLLSELMPDLLS